MKTKKRTRQLDEELVRVQGMLNLIDDLNDRFWRLKRDLGEETSKRVGWYINARKGWVLRRFTEPQP
jgi:hypothetical protein